MTPESRDHQAKVSFLIVVKNGAVAIQRCLDCFYALDFPHQQLELIIVDGGSTDETLKIVETAIHEHPDISSRILNNPNGILSSGWNIGIREARYDILLRVDVHATFGPEFLNANIAALELGHPIVGGIIESRRNPMGSPLIYAFESSRFCGGAADFRNPGKPRWIDTVGYAAYNRKVFLSCGLFHELLVRNQDIEMHIRLSRAGYRFWFDPSIRSYHHGRSTSVSFLKQKFLNGYWVALTFALVKRYPYPRHILPAAFVAALLLCVALGVLGFGQLPFLSIIALHLLAGIPHAIHDINRIPDLSKFLLPVVMLGYTATHMAYGAGSLVGLLRLSGFRGKCRHRPAPILKERTS